MQLDKFQAAAHHVLIAQHLEAVERNELKRLIVALPPRSGKTLLSSEFFPAWYLGRNPGNQIIYATYSFERAADVGRKVRNQINSELFQEVFPDCIISPDSKSANKLSTMQDGNYYAVGVGGALSGRGANCLVGSTKIQTEIGNIKLKKLVRMKRKPRVLSFNFGSNTLEYRSIVAWQQNITSELYTVSTENHRSTSGTNDHLFYVENKGWVNAQQLQAKDLLKTCTVLSQIKTDTAFSVTVNCNKEHKIYDIQVEGNNNFFANGILVHNCLIIDDPVKGRKEVESELLRRQLVDWFQGVAYTRLQPNGAIIIIATRWHFDDLIGFLLSEKKHENWTVLELPAIAEEPNDLIGRKVGEALWVDAYPLPVLKNIRDTIGTRDWTALYQQRPVPGEGGMVQLEWFQRYHRKHIHRFLLKDIRTEEQRKHLQENDKKITKIVCSWDTAFKEGELNDPSACTVWGIGEDGFYLLWVLNKRLDFPKLKKTVIQMYERNLRYDLGQVPVLIEDRASGQSLIQELQQHTKIPVIPIKADANKKIRMSEVTALIEAGKVFLPEKAPWLVEYETQMIQFPFGKFDDLVDSTSQFLRWAGKPRYAKSKKPLFWK